MTEENIQMIYDMCADRIRETDTVAAYRYGCSDSCINNKYKYKDKLSGNSDMALYRFSVYIEL